MSDSPVPFCRVDFKKAAPSALCFERGFFFFLLENDSEEAGDNPEQCHTFYEGGCQDHVGADVTGSFGLASDRFYRAATDLTDANASTQCRKTCTDSATCCVQTAVNYCYGVVRLEEDGVQQRHDYGFG